MDKGASPLATGPSQVEPVPVSPFRASVPSAASLKKQRLSAYPVFERGPSALDVLAAAGFSRADAKDALSALARGGYVIGPKMPTNAMLLAYLNAHGQFPRNPETILRAICKARKRWQAMGEAGTSAAFSNRFSNNDDQGNHIEAGMAPTRPLDLSDLDAAIRSGIRRADTEGFREGAETAHTQAIEARRAETLGSVHESAVGKADAPEKDPNHDQR